MHALVLLYINQHMKVPCFTSSKDVLFCSLAVLDPRVGHTMDVLYPFISVLCHYDRLYHG